MDAATPSPGSTARPPIVEVQALIAPFVDAAAVLSTFELNTLQPIDPRDANVNRNDALIELTNFCPSSGARIERVDRWQLEESRVAWDATFWNTQEGMRRARVANKVRQPRSVTSRAGYADRGRASRPRWSGLLLLEQLLSFERRYAVARGHSAGLTLAPANHRLHRAATRQLEPSARSPAKTSWIARTISSSSPTTSKCCPPRAYSALLDAA